LGHGVSAETPCSGRIGPSFAAAKLGWQHGVLQNSVHWSDWAPLCCSKAGQAARSSVELRALVGLGPISVENRAESMEFLRKLRAMVGLDQLRVAKLVGNARFCRNGHWKYFGPDFRKRKSGLEAQILRIWAGFDRNPGFLKIFRRFF